MGSFQRALLGYRRRDVDAALGGRDAQIAALRRELDDAVERWRDAAGAAARSEQELTALAAMVIEREREIRDLNARLREANERHDRSIASLEAMGARLEEIQAQARGQATRIRMKALREAIEIGRGAQHPGDADAAEAGGLFEGTVKLEIGPLGDFSQLVGLEDAIGQLGASEISVERFSEGRATISLRLDQPVDLLCELEQRSPLDFRVRRASGENLVLDIDEDQGSETQAA